jgi:hypothetical protein
MVISHAEISASPGGSYGQDLDFDWEALSLQSNQSSTNNHNNSPPALPAHLQHALLNTRYIANDPTLLPLPHHVMLNHLYTWPKKDDDNVCIFGITQRYKNKFVTTVFYQPLVRNEGGDHCAETDTVDLHGEYHSHQHQT